MKSVFFVLFLSLTPQAFGDGNSCQTHKAGSDCEIVRTYTKCDVDKQALRRRIYALEKQLKQVQTEYKEFQVRYLNEPTVVKTVYKRTEVEKTVVKHYIVSLYTSQDVTGSGTNANTAYVNTAYVPGIKGQYQFNFGLVPEVGVNTQGHFMFGLGFEF